MFEHTMRNNKLWGWIMLLTGISCLLVTIFTFGSAPFGYSMTGFVLVLLAFALSIRRFVLLMKEGAA